MDAYAGRIDSQLCSVGAELDKWQLVVLIQTHSLGSQMDIHS